MLKSMKNDLILFVAGGVSYGVVELLWRQRTHWSMILTGGACFLSLYKLYRRYPRLSLPEKCVLGSLVITTLEFIVGCIVNIKLGLKVWDYSKVPFNLLGQICLVYSVLWGALCLPISYVCSLISKRTDKKERSRELC